MLLEAIGGDDAEAGRLTLDPRYLGGERRALPDAKWEGSSTKSSRLEAHQLTGWPHTSQEREQQGAKLRVITS